MFWADKIAKKIIDSGMHKPYWVDDMKTPSGRVHVGSLRGVLIHDLIHKALVDAGQAVTFSYVFDDQDPMDGLPVYLDKNIWSKYLGMPLFNIQSPEKGSDNYGAYFAAEFIEVFNRVGAYPKIIRGSELYKSGKMNEGIKKCLDNVSIIREIYHELYKKKPADNWYPFHVVCPKCGKESTTKVSSWDGKLVSFVCKEDAVDWTNGCGFGNKVSPFSEKGNFSGKLSWKVEWAVKWQAIGVTVEGAGKDHMTAGGSHDVAKQIAKKILNYPVPFNFSHEFFLFGGKKMSSSKGLGSSAKEVSEILPPELLRFLFTRTDYRQAIEFNLVGTMAIPDLFDEYDRSWQAYVSDSDANLSRIFVLSQPKKIVPKQKIYLARFRQVVNFIQQPGVEINDQFAKLKGSALTQIEKIILNEREKYAKLWLEKYAPDEVKTQMTENISPEVEKLDQQQVMFLEKTIKLLEKETSAQNLQLALYNETKALDLDVKKAFGAIYLSILGKAHGPKAAWLLLNYPKEKIIRRMEEVIKLHNNQIK